MYIPRNTVMEKPIQLVNILRADVNFMVNRRILIIAEDGAQARLLVCDHAMDDVNFLSTQVIEVFAGAGASLDLYELEETHNSTVRFSNLYVDQQADSKVLLNGMTLHNGTTRNTTRRFLCSSCHGTMLEWCSMTVTIISSPLQSESPNDDATKFIPSVVPRVKIISSVEPALMNSLTLLRASSTRSVASCESVCTPR